MALIIDHDAVGRTLGWSESIDLLAEMSRHEAAGRTFVSPKFNSDFETGSMRILFAADYETGYGATKAYHTIDGIGSRYLVSLIDLRSGELLAVVDGRRITDLRTGAASGLVARRMRFDRPVSVGIVGSGHQARAQLESLAAACEIGEAAVFSPTRKNRDAFAAELGERLGIDIEAAASAEAAARGRDIVAVASKSRSAEPVVLGRRKQLFAENPLSDPRSRSAVHGAVRPHPRGLGCPTGEAPGAKPESECVCGAIRSVDQVGVSGADHSSWRAPPSPN